MDRGEVKNSNSIKQILHISYVIQALDLFSVITYAKENIILKQSWMW